MRKFYISGPITGIENYEERFSKAQKELESKGYLVINPAAVGAVLPNELSHQDYMRISFILLSLCDDIYLLSGWGKSDGAVQEYIFATAMEKGIWFENGDEADGDL